MRPQSRPCSIALAAVVSLTGCQKIVSLFAEEPTREKAVQSLCERGHDALAAGDIAKAEKLFLEASSMAAFDIDAQAGLGMVYAADGRDAQAIFALKRAAEFAPENPQVLSLLADLMMRQGKAKAAAEALQAAAKSAEAELAPEVRLRLGRALLRSDRLGEAAKILEKVRSEAPNDAETLAILAELRIAEGDEGRAMKLLESAMAANPKVPLVRLTRARYFNSRGKTAEALRELEAATQVAPDDPDVKLALARSLALAGKAPEGMQVAEQVVRKRPSDIVAKGILAEVRLIAGDLRGAREMAENVLSEYPKAGRALYVRALAIEGETPDDPVRALHAYEEALEADPMQPAALSRMWPIYLKLGRRTDAISAIEHLIILGEATHADEVELASLYAKTGLNADRGLRIILAAMKREPGNKRYAQIKRQLGGR